MTPASFDLDADQPTVTVEAAYSKHRKRDAQPIRADLATMLADWLEGKPADGPVFTMPPKGVDMLRADLTAAGVAYETDSGFADFHSLRHTYISRIVRRRGLTADAIALARHSSPTLTARYAHARLADTALALDALPENGVEGAHHQAHLSSTKTCHRRPSSANVVKLAQAG